MGSIVAPSVGSRYFSCQVCQRGILVHKKIFRMSGPAVAIGFILLIPSLLGIAASALLLLGVVSGGAAGVHSARNSAVANMRENGVPNPIIASVMAGEDQKAERMMDEWPESYEINGQVVHMRGLPEYQRTWVHAAQAKLRGANVASGLGIMHGSEFAIVLGIGSFVGGLLGWLLVMRKRVLQCSLCRAVINAS